MKRIFKFTLYLIATLYCLYLAALIVQGSKYQSNHHKYYNFDATVSDIRTAQNLVTNIFQLNDIELVQFGPGVDYKTGGLGLRSYHLSDKSFYISVTLHYEPNTDGYSQDLLQISLSKPNWFYSHEDFEGMSLLFDGIAKDFEKNEYFILTKHWEQGERKL